MKLKNPGDVSTGNDVTGPDVDSTGPKRFCNGACSNKAEETDRMGSLGVPT